MVLSTLLPSSTFHPAHVSKAGCSSTKMSSDSASVEAEVIDLASKFFNVNCSIIAAAVLMVYDTALTFDREVICVWKRKFSLVTILFICMRYGTLVSKVISTMMGVIPQEFLYCSVIERMSMALVLLVMLAQSIFTSLRLWAIWDRNCFVLAIVLPVALVPIGVNVYLLVLSSPYTNDSSGLPSVLNICEESINISLRTYLIVPMVSRSFSILGDAQGLIATWIKTWYTRRELKAVMQDDFGHSQPSISDLILRDGTLYFATLLALNIAVLVLDISLISGSNPAGTFIDTLTSILLCRLILNLRSFNHSEVLYSMPALSINPVLIPGAIPNRSWSSSFVESALDNIGASLSFEDRRGEEEIRHTEVDVVAEDSSHWQHRR